jgi:acyl-CoA dehydrogenase
MRSIYETEDRAAFRETVKRFVANEIAPHVDEWDEAGEVPWELHQKAGDIGLFGFGIDERYGGLGFDDCFMRVIMGEELAKSGSGGVGAALAGCNIMTGPIQLLASEEIKGRALPEIMSGRSGGALGITEPGGGSDVAAMQTTAVLDGDDWVINGSKTFITGGMRASYFVVGARTGEPGLAGISLFFIEKDTPGFTQTKLDRKMGWWCSDTAALYFDDCRVPASSMIGKENEGFLAIMNNFNLERVGLIASALGSSKLCLEESIRYAQERHTFGKPLIKHQVIRHKIAEMSARIDSVEAYINQISWLINEGEMPVAEICKAKFWATEVFEFAAREALQIFGGAGYLRGTPVERMYREVRVLAIGGGSEEIMRDLAVRQMGL